MQEQIDAYKYFLTDQGKAEIAKTIQEFKTQYGAQWLTAIKANFSPVVHLVVDLAANYTAHDAYLKLTENISAQITESFRVKKETAQTKGFWEHGKVAVEEQVFRAAALGTLQTYKTELFGLHEFLKTEIDRKRF